MPRALVVVALLVGAWLQSSPAFAQNQPLLLPTIASIAAPPLTSNDLAAAERDERAHRADYRIAIGAGLLAASVAHLGAFGRKGACYDDRLITPWLTAPVFAIGGGVLLGTAVADLHGARRSKPARDIAQKVLASIGTSLLAGGLMFGIAAREWLGCIQS